MPLPAPVAFKAGSFTVPKDPAEVEVTGVGFRPKAVVLVSVGNSATGSAEGAGTDAERKGLSVSVFSDANLGGSAKPTTLFEAASDGHTGSGSGDNSCGFYPRAFKVRDASDALVVDATFVEMTDDGFTLDFTDVDGLEQIVGYMAMGGDSMLVRVVQWTMPSTVGYVTHQVTGAGFRPAAALHLFGSILFTGDDWDDSHFVLPSNANQRSLLRLGAMDALGNQWALGFERRGDTDPTAETFFRNDRVLFGSDEGGDPFPSYDVDASFVSMDPDGFTLQVASLGPAWAVSLCIGGCEARVGSLEKPAANGDTTVSVGFEPAGLILASAMADFGGTTPIAAGNVGIGLASVFDEIAVTRHDEHQVDPMVALKRTEEVAFYGREDETTSATLNGFAPDGFELGWTTASASYPVAYLALGSLPASTVRHRFEAELNGVGLGWTDITEDVLIDPGVSIRYGIAGTGPLDLVASTGTMKLVLNNSEDNSAGLMGYYSPRHRRCRPGFALGIRIRFTYLIPGSSDGYGKFIGRLRDIQPEPGQYRDRKTVCQVVDYMNELAISRYNLATQLDKRPDEILELLLDEVPRQPDGTDFDVADSTFPYALDNGPVERSTAITEVQRLCQSEFGRCYIRGGLNTWGELRFEKRTARLIPSPVATFDGTMQELDAGSGAGKVKNKAKVTVHPRRVDSAATTVLFAKPSQQNPAVLPTQTIRVSGRYVDPSNPNARIGGTDMVTPAATTDYTMNAAQNGSGSDLTANFSVTAAYGANQVDYTITNNGGTTGYVTKLQARGRGLYDYDPLEAEESNEDSIESIGESAVTLDMPYQGLFTTAEAIAEFLVATWSSHEPPPNSSRRGSPGVTEASIRVTPRTVPGLTQLMALEPGVAITVREELSVVNDVYFIQGVQIRIDGDSVDFDFDLQRALIARFWQLGDAGFSELGDTTVLAPL